MRIAINGPDDDHLDPIYCCESLFCRQAKEGWRELIVKNQVRKRC